MVDPRSVAPVTHHAPLTDPGRRTQSLTPPADGAVVPVAADFSNKLRRHILAATTPAEVWKAFSPMGDVVRTGAHAQCISCRELPRDNSTTTARLVDDGTSSWTSTPGLRHLEISNLLGSTITPAHSRRAFGGHPPRRGQGCGSTRTLGGSGDGSGVRDRRMTANSAAPRASAATPLTPSATTRRRLGRERASARVCGSA